MKSARRSTPGSLAPTRNARWTFIKPHAPTRKTRSRPHQFEGREVNAMEPDFLSQNGENLTPEQSRAWFQERAKEAEAQGARLHRFSIHPTEPHLFLYEGWKDPRASQDG